MIADAGKILGRGISFPPRVGADGRMEWSEGETNVRESIRVILLTEQRERIRLTDFGGSLGQYLFEPNNVMTRHLIEDRITKALAQWEPRIRVESITVEAVHGAPQEAVATINYKLIATQARERVTMNVTLGS
jgi:phage baseplate assembly protein W